MKKIKIKDAVKELNKAKRDLAEAKTELDKQVNVKSIDGIEFNKILNKIMNKNLTRKCTKMEKTS